MPSGRKRARRLSLVWGVTLVALTSLIVVACGGSDKSGPSAASSSDSPATASAALVEPTAETAASDTAADISPETCPILLDMIGGAATALGAPGDTAGDGVEYTSAFFHEMAQRAPSEIRDDLELIADAYGPFLDLAAELGIDFSDLTTLDAVDVADEQRLDAAAAALSAPDVKEASLNVQTYLEREC